MESPGAPAAISRRGISSICALAFIACVAWAEPALALFHIAVIDEVMSGLAGTDDVQFVEIRMLAGSQNIVTGSKLSAFDASGNFLRVVLTVAGNVTGGMNRAWIMGSTAFAAASGITPDFTFTSSGGLGLEPNDGMVCWGKPSNDANPGQYVDCVAYGNYVGPGNIHIGTPNPIAPFGHALVRVSNTNNNAADFACNDPAEPENNAMAIGSIAASAPCPVCSNNITEPGEECDGTDDIACPGLCDVDCTCTTVCGDNLKDVAEQCDGTDDTACPGNCQFDCTCAPTGPLGPADQKCATSTAKAARKTVSSVGKEVNGCVKSIASGATVDPLSTCVTADVKQKITKSETKLGDTIAKVCPTSAFAYAANCPAPCDATDVDGTSEAIDDRNELVSCLLCLDRAVSYTALGDGGTHGEILNGATLATTAANAALAACQGALVKATEKLFSTQIKELVTCAQGALKGGATPPVGATCIGADPKTKIQKAAAKLATAAACTPPAVYDAGACATLTGLALSNCLNAEATCQSCIWGNSLLGSTVDCDLEDNGSADASCP